MDCIVCVCLITAYSIHRYQHSRHLVNTLNQFADVKADLPSGWEKKLNKEGKVSGKSYHYTVHIHLLSYKQQKPSHGNAHA